MPWTAGIYTRGYASWSADAAANLPISSTKFDTEDNDFAAGLNNCLTKDGLSIPNAAMSWSLPSAQVLALTRGNDGAIFSFGRTGGSNNPVAILSAADATGASLSLTSGAFNLVAPSGITIGSPTGGGQGAGTINATGIFVNAAPIATVGSNNTWTGQNLFTGAVSTSIAASGASLGSDSGDGSLVIITAGSPANQKIWEFFADPAAGVLFGRSLNDAFNVASNWLQVNRSGVPITGIILGNSTDKPPITLNGNTTILNGGVGGTGLTVGAVGDSVNQMTVNAKSSGQALVQLNTSGTEAFTLVNNQTGAPVLGIPTGQCGLSTFAGQVLALVSSGGINVVGNLKAQDSGGTLQDVGWRDVPQNAQSGNYALALADRGKSVAYTGAGGNTFTIPANASIAFPIGAAITIPNTGSGNITIAITTDTLKWAPAGTTGSRTLAANGLATIIKVASTTWMISGVGLT